MSITITKLKMWKNVGYTERCSEVPPPGSWKLPNPDFASATGVTYRPRKGNTLTSIELPLSLCQVFEMSYLYMEFEDNAHNQCKVFGWIHSVEVTASSDEAVKIEWTPDWWRTYAGTVTFDSGVVKRTSDSTHRRPSVFTPRYKRASLHQMINPSGTEESMFCIMKVTYSYNVTPAKTSIRTYVFPLGEGVFIRSGGTDTLKGIAPGMSQINAGYVDECLGLDANNIQGAWIVPFNVFNSMDKISGGFAGSDSIWKSETNLFNGVTYATFYSEGDPIASILNMTFTQIASDDLDVYGVADMRGNLISILPWGIPVSRVWIGVNLGTVNASLVLRFDNGSSTNPKCAFSEGLGVSIPLPSVPVGSNSYSSYVYSGQRDYEMAVNETSQRMNYEKGTVSALGGALEGGIGGAIAGKGTGAIIGATGGLAMSMGQQIWLNDIETKYRDTFQRFEDMKYAMQSSNILIPGEGNDWNNVNISPRYPYIVKLSADSVSAGEYNNMISKNGYESNYFAIGNLVLQSLMMDGKSLQVEQLVIVGNAPPQAKNTIKTMLEEGVRVKEYNPSGVIP